MTFMNGLTLPTPSQSVLDGFIGSEPVDIAVIDKLLNSDLLRDNNYNSYSLRGYPDEYKQLEKYRNKINDGIVQTVYTKAKNMKFGRVHVFNAPGLFSFRRGVRHTLAFPYFEDIDMENAYPSILLQILKKNNIECKHLENYCNNREYFLNKWISDFNIDRDTAKKLILVLLHFGTYEGWLKNIVFVPRIMKEQNFEKKDDAEVYFKKAILKGEIKLKPADPFIFLFVKERDEYAKKIIDSNPELSMEIDKRKKIQEKFDFNRSGAVVSYFLQHIENLFLETIFSWCVDNGYIKDNKVVLCHDGIMIDKNLYKPELLTIFSQLIKDKFDFDIKFENKVMDKSYLDILDSHIVSPSLEKTDKPEEPVRKFINREIASKKIHELMSLVDIKRYDNEWKIIASSLKNTHYKFEVFEKWALGNPSFNLEETQNFWLSNRFIDVTITRVYEMAKLDNPDAYEKFAKKYTKVPICMNFTPHKTIYQKHITSDIYNLDKHNIIALKSNMNTGKTYCIKNLFPKYQKIIVVYQRITLNNEIYQKWKDFGFELYSNIKDYYLIDTEKHPRVIVQVDSLHRLRGSCDLLLLDEIESLTEHLCGSTYMQKTSEVFRTLCNYVKNTPKIILADANLRDDTVNILFEGKRNREVYKIENKYLSFDHIQTCFYNCSDTFTKHLLSALEDGKKIVVPTNSKSKAKLFSKLIREKFPYLKVLLMTSEEKFKSIQEWDDKDVILYTPTIVAGISYEKIRFHCVYGYFINKSASAEQVSQMLFRVRNLIDNEMHIYCSNETLNGNFKPHKLPEIGEFINENIRVGNNTLNFDDSFIDKFNKRAKNCRYFKLYAVYLQKKNTTFDALRSYLFKILKNHGVDIYFNLYQIEDEEEKKQLVETMTEISDGLKVEDAQKIMDAPDINSEIFKKLVDKRTDLSPQEVNSMKKYTLKDAFEVSELPDIEWVKTNVKYTNAYRNYKFFSYMEIDAAIFQCESLRDNHYENELKTEYQQNPTNNSDDEFISSSSEDEDNKDKLKSFVADRRFKKKIFKNVSKIVHKSIHYNKRYFKLYYCLNFLKVAGFSSVNDTQKLKFDHMELWDYCRENEPQIRALWNSKKIDFEVKSQLEGKDKQSLLKYVNSKLSECLGISISRDGTKYKKETYTINVNFINFSVKDIVKSIFNMETSENIFSYIFTV